MNAQTRYEYSVATGLQVQRMDSDVVDCPVAGYGPGTTVEDAQIFVARERGVLRVYGATATPAGPATASPGSVGNAGDPRGMDLAW